MIILRRLSALTFFVSLVVVQGAFGSQSLVKKTKIKRQYIENDSYFKSSRMDSLSARVAKDEKPWGIGLNASTGTDLVRNVYERTYNQALSISGTYALTPSQSVGSQFGVNYYSVGNTIPKEEGNPAWDDLSVSWRQKLGEYNNVKLSHNVASFAPTSYDSQYEGIKTGLSYELGASHQFYRVKFNHRASVGYTQHTFNFSPTTNRKNTPWHNSYNFSVGIPYKISKKASLGISGNVANRSAFDNDYVLVTSTLIYGSFEIGEASISLNYLVGSYDENKTFRYFYVNDWEQKISIGVSYDL